MTEPAHHSGSGAPVGGAAAAPRNRAFSLWAWVAGAFLVSLLAWVVMFKAAQSANVQSVPLAPKGARP